METSRFAPTPSGDAHLGTLVAALLAWLDARKNNARFILRFEDLDAHRCKNKFSLSIKKSLIDLGIDWDAIFVQSSLIYSDSHTYANRYEKSMQHLFEKGLLYSCSCTRKELSGRLDEGSSSAIISYDNHCRFKKKDITRWQDMVSPIRLRLPDNYLEGEYKTAYQGLSGKVHHASHPLGDPTLLRRDGFYSYVFACVVDDDLLGVTRIVRGRDILLMTPIQIYLQHCLGYKTPTYIHHGLVITEDGKRKLSKSYADPKGLYQHAIEIVKALNERKETKDILLRKNNTSLEQLLNEFQWTDAMFEDIYI